METIGNFVNRLCADVGCYNKKNEKIYSLKKYPSQVKGQMGVFGWVKERSRKSLFIVSTYKYLADQQAVLDADSQKPGAHYLSRGKDSEGRATGLFFYVANDSNGKDYQKTVRALKVIMRNKR